MPRKDNIRHGHIHWKQKDTFGIVLIVCLGLIMTPISLWIRGVYDIFFNICLGLFIGGIIMTIISLFLAQMESNISGEGDIDIDVDADIDIDVDADVDIDVDADVDIDVDADVDVDVDVDVDADIDLDVDSDIDVNVISDITPAPIMLLFSTALLFFGISGIILYFYVNETFRFIIFFITPLFTYIITKITNFFWKKIAKSEYYKISSTRNLIGVEGVVILPVDNISGLIKIKSHTPMKFEKIPVKPLNPYSVFERGDKVYICTTRQGILLVDNKLQSIKKKLSKKNN